MHKEAPAPVRSPAPSASPERSRAGSAKGSQARAPKGSGSGSKEQGSGSGSIPDIPGVAWERHTKGGFEAWHAPAGKATPRKQKVYLAYVGKRRLSGSPDQIAEFVRSKAREKGIDLP